MSKMMVLEKPGSVDVLAELLRSDPETAFDYLEFRSWLAGTCAAWAAERATPKDIALIESAFQDMEAAYHAGDARASALADARFHLATYVAAHNELMLHIMKRIFGLICEDVFFSHEELYQRVGVRERFLRQHRAIFDAISAGNAEAARLAADEHNVSTVEAVREATRAEGRLKTSVRRRDGLSYVPNGTL